MVISNCSNNYGPFQFPEKLVPLIINNAFQDKELPVYGDGMNIRDWLYVEDHCSAIDIVLHEGKVGEVYNIGGNNEWHNIDIVKDFFKGKEIFYEEAFKKFEARNIVHQIIKSCSDSSDNFELYKYLKKRARSLSMKDLKGIEPAKKLIYIIPSYSIAKLMTRAMIKVKRVFDL